MRLTRLFWRELLLFRCRRRLGRRLSDRDWLSGRREVGRLAPSKERLSLGLRRLVELQLWMMLLRERIPGLPWPSLFCCTLLLL
jgi:hypothetical protein